MTDNEKLLWTLGIAGGGYYYLYRRSLKPEDLGWYGATVGGVKRRAHTAIEAEAERVDAFLSTAELEVNKQKAKYKKQFEDRCKTNRRRVKKMLVDVQEISRASTTRSLTRLSDPWRTPATRRTTTSTRSISPDLPVEGGPLDDLQRAKLLLP